MCSVGVHNFLTREADGGTVVFKRLVYMCCNYTRNTVTLLVKDWNIYYYLYAKLHGVTSQKTV